MAKKDGVDNVRLMLGLCLVLGLALSLFLFRRDAFVSTDGCAYVLLGKNLASGLGYTSWGGPHLWFPPGYPLAIGAFYLITGDPELAAHAVSIVSFLISTLLLFRLSSMVYGRSAALLAVILFMVNRSVLENSHATMAHSLDMALVTAAACLAATIINKNGPAFRYFVLLGIVLAGASLNRPENIILSVAVVSCLLFQTGGRLLRRLAAFSCLILAFGITVFPYVNFIHRHTGEWTLTAKVTNLQHYEYLYSNDPLGREKMTKARVSDFDLLRYIKKEKEALAARYLQGAKQLPGVLSGILFGAPGFLLICLGLFWQKLDKDKLKVQVLLLSCLSPLVIVPFGNMRVRYFLSVVPVFMVWMGRGLENVYLLMKGRLKCPVRQSAAVVCCVVVLLALPTARFLFFGKNTGLAYEHKEMGLWMKDNIEGIESRKIASRKPWVPFYSGGAREGIPFSKDDKSLPSYLRSRGIDYLIIDERFTSGVRPLLRPLLDDAGRHDGLSRVHVIREPKKIVLYKVE
ncbi:MAG: glycosyltransferase family 39 protein [Candidatus Omnitrophota bacterium]